MINKIKKWSIDFFAKEDSTYHILAFVISSALFPSIPIIWFIIFMNEKMIFSYDFFTNGMFGLSIFFVMSLILLLFFGFLLVGSIVFFIIYLYKKKGKLNEEELFIIVFFILNIYMLVSMFNKLQIDEYIYIVFFNIFLFIHIGVLYAGKGIHKFFTLILLTLFLTFSTIYYHHVISSFIEYGLLQFRMGGDIKTKIIDMKNHENIIEGNLTLLTPNKVFLHRDKTITIFNRDNIIIEIIDKNITK